MLFLVLGVLSEHCERALIRVHVIRPAKSIQGVGSLITIARAAHLDWDDGTLRGVNGSRRNRSAAIVFLAFIIEIIIADMQIIWIRVIRVCRVRDHCFAP